MTSKGNGREPSMDEIMAQIRSIIAADESKGRPAAPRSVEKSGEGDVLDLTEMVNDDGSVTKVSGAPSGPPSGAPAPKGATIIEPEQGFTSMPTPPADLAPIFANAGPSDGPPMPQGQPQPRPAAPPPIVSAPPPPPPAPPPAPKPAPAPVIVQTNTPQPAIVMPPPAPPPRPQPGPSPAPMSDLLSNAAAGAAASALERLAAVNQQQQPKPAAPPPGPAMPSIGGRSVEDVVQDMLRPMLKQWLDANLPAIVERMVAAEIAKISKR